MNTPYENIREARELLSKEKPDLDRAAVLAKALKDQSKYAYAAELYLLLYERVASEKNKKEYLDALVHCLYKDPDLPSSQKFDLATYYLKKLEDPRTSHDPEVLGKMGAIYKYKWQYDNQYRNLLFSRYYYKRGYEFWRKEFVEKPGKTGGAKTQRLRYNTGSKDRDAGYTAINYAFVLDLMANVRLDITAVLPETVSDSAAQQLREAERLRNEILAYFSADGHYKKDIKPDHAIDQHWAYATIAEAYFGLGKYEEAKKYYGWYAQGKDKPNDWQIESTARQLTSLAQLHIQLGPFRAKIDHWSDKRLQSHGFDANNAACACLSVLYDRSIAQQKELPDIALRGKVGLALSGGGFRAALFHVGVLARLAELNVLRHVEVLSCVSGGSILGAYYYLLLKEKMDAKTDSELSREHYVQIVEKLVKQFRLAVQKNIRVRVLSSWRKNLLIFFSKDYTRTQRLGELYEEILYHELLENTRQKGKPIYIHELKINPGGNTDFNIKTMNWYRLHKVPMLVLNATSLNTGHNWQFTATWMGEPPGNIQQKIDSKPRLRRMYYDEAPSKYNNKIRLGTAVGASSCVPALFEPLLLRDLYPDVDLMLVDGGVQDNQGVSSLLEQECKVLIVSDASGQLPNEATLGAGAVNSFFRSDMVLQEKVREYQLTDLVKRQETSQLAGLVYVQLKKDLHANPVKWVGCKEPTRRIWLNQGDPENITHTSYGILKNVQEHLAALRTDLDAFSDAEAYALMYSGYCQADTDFKEGALRALFKQDYEENKEKTEQWEFLHMARWMREPEPSTLLLSRLKVGKFIPFKVFYTSWLLRIIAAVPILLLIGVIGYLLYRFRLEEFSFTVTIKAIGIALIIYVADMLLSGAASRVFNYKSSLLKALFYCIGAFLIAWLSKLYLLALNPLYLKWGKIPNLEREDKLKKWAKKIWDFIS